MKKLGKKFLLILLTAVTLRILLLIWVIPLPFASNGDLTRYEDWAQVAHIYSLSDTYSSKHLGNLLNNQPPGTLYALSATYETYIIAGKLIAHITHTKAGSILWVNTFFLHLWMRFPSILAELIMGILAYLLVAQKKDDTSGLLAAGLIWFNPALFYNSTLWGQMDSINNVFFILSLFFAFRKNILLSVFSYAVSLYIKLSLLPLLPFYVIFLFFLCGKKLFPLIRSFLLAALGIVIATFAISNNPLMWLVLHLPQLAGGELQNVTNAAFNFWWAITCGPTCNYPPVIDVTFLWITLNIWGYVFFAIATLPLLYLQLKKNVQLITKEHIILGFSLVAFATFLFLPKMHDRYLYPFFPLFAIFIGLTKYKKNYLILYTLLSLMHLLNLIYSWFPTYFPYFFIYRVVYSRLYDWILSLFIVSLAAIVYGISYLLLWTTPKSSSDLQTHTVKRVRKKPQRKK